MALVVHPTPVDGPRRSTRIRVRRQTNLSRPSCLLAHTQTAVSRRTHPRSTHAADLSIHPNPSAIVASLATHAKSGFHPTSSLPSASPSKRRTRASSGSSSTALSSSRNKRPAARKQQISVVGPHPSSSLPILAGSKRKRSQNAPDRPDRLAYELVPIDGVLPVADKAAAEADEEFQTPRQLRYAKRQRLLTSLSDNETPATRADVGRLRDGSRAPPGDAPQPQGSGSATIGKAGEPRGERSGSRERGAHRPTTNGRLLTVGAPAATRPSTSYNASNTSPEERARPERPPTPRPKAIVSDATPPSDVPPPLPAPSFTEPCTQPTLPDPAAEEPAEPTLCPFHRLKLPPRERRPETADTGLWKLACQERVEFLKETYREIYEAVVQAEELAAQRFLPQAPSTASDSVTSSPVTAPFTLYTPSSCAAAARVDADGDMDMDADGDLDVGYSSDWDSDEDEDKSEEDDDLLFDAHAQTLNPFGNDNGDATNNNNTIGWSPSAQAFGPPTLPPLASVPVYALECVPEQTARNGVPFMGRGTPVDRTRRSEWASPPVPLLPRAIAMDMGVGCSPWMRSSASRPFYAPQPEMAFPGMEMGMGMGMGMGFDAMQIDVVHVQPQQQQQQFGRGEYAEHECMPWLDPALRAPSESPSPSPAPYVVSIPCTPPPQQQQQDFAMASPEYPSTPDLSPSPSISISSGSSSPTGCAWHATFLQCLQSPTGCAPCFSAPSTPSPVPAPVPVPVPVTAPAYVEPPSPTPAPQHRAAPTQAFIDIPSAQGMEPPDAFAMAGGAEDEDGDEGYVRRPHAHARLLVVSGSVTLSHALG